MGLNEFEQSVKLLHEKKYEGAEGYLKDAMKILKSAGQEKSLGYLYLLKRLGYVCFLNGKYAESEKYFKINADMIANVTKNPVNIFSAQRNLLLLYTYTNLDSAMEWGNRLMKDTDEMLPVSNKELCFLMGVRYSQLFNLLF